MPVIITRRNAPGPTIIQEGNKILYFNPGYESGLDFKPRAKWIFNGQIFEAVAEKTLVADAELDRINSFALTSDGQIIVLEGQPAENPTEPEYNPTTQLKASIVLVKAGAETPDGINFITIYNENLGTAFGEFDVATDNEDAVNFAAGDDPSFGDVHIAVTNIQSQDSITFLAANPIPVKSVSQLNYKIFQKAAQAAGSRQHTFVLLGTDINGNFIKLEIPQDSSFHPADTTGYQRQSITIPQGTRMEFINQVQLFILLPNVSFLLDEVEFIGGIDVGVDENFATVDYVNEKAPIITIEGNPFFWRKLPSNNTNTIQPGDIAYNGWISQNKFGVILTYVGGDTNSIDSWNVYSDI